MSRGVLYISAADDYCREACLSAKILKRSMPDVPTALITDGDGKYPYIDTVIEMENPRYDFGDKVFNIHRTPFDRTLFLDTDTYVYSDVSELFDVLDEFDLAAAHVPHWGVHDRTSRDVPECYPEFNTGVLAFRDGDPVRDLFDRWREEYERDLDAGENEDQFSFRRVSYESDARIATLPGRYNIRYDRIGKVVGEGKIFHGRLLDVEGHGLRKSTDVEDAVAKINGYRNMRVFVNSGHLRVMSSDDEMPWYHQVDGSIRRNGVTYTVKRAAERAWNRVR